MLKVEVTVWRRAGDAPADEFGALPWRASTACPFTGELVRAAGDCESAATYSLGRALMARIRKHSAEEPRQVTLEVRWSG